VADRREANGLKTSAFGIIVGAKVPLPEPGTKAPQRDEWLIVLGGSGTVGHFAIQVRWRVDGIMKHGG
jgi:NADPH:quinone reductase-like Zn-dependent oxidoreductase